MNERKVPSGTVWHSKLPQCCLRTVSVLSVSVLSQRCPIPVLPVSVPQCCLRSVLLLSQCYLSQCYFSVVSMLYQCSPSDICLSVASVLSQSCLRIVSVLFHWYMPQCCPIAICFSVASVLYQGCLIIVSVLFRCCLSAVSVFRKSHLKMTYTQV